MGSVKKKDWKRETLKNGEHIMTDMEVLEEELKSLVGEKQVEEINTGLGNSYNHIVRVLLDASIDSPAPFDSFLHCYQFGHQ